MPLAPGARLGPYEIQAAIGAGGMGEVYKARDTRLDRTVAVKVLPAEISGDPDRRARFEREAKIIAGLNHSHICTLHDVGIHDGVIFLVMEHLAGQTLAERLEKGPLPLDQVLTIAAEIADALSAAHRQGVIHRDLKPGNVMLTKAGAKLLDFGLAKLTGHGERPVAVQIVTAAPTHAASLTGQGVIVGTLPYMAPEQLEGKPPDARTDLWALGAIIYEMLTGKRAFEGTNTVSLMGAILEREPPPMVSVQPLTPPALDRLVRQCLAKSPDGRWESAHDVGNELRSLREGNGLPGRGAVAPHRVRWRGLAWVAAAGLAGLLVGATALWLLQRPRPVPAAVLRALLDVYPAEELNTGATSSWMPTPGGARTAFAWTPDGRTLVFAGRRGDVRQLYVRALDRSRPTPLPGTEGVRTLAISPDGQSVVFWAGRSLKKTPLGGGPVSEMAAGIAEVPMGLTCDEVGNLYFGRDDGRIWKVAATGGLIAVTTNDVGRHTLPWLLPGSKVLLYTVRGQTIGWGGEEVVAQTLTTGQRKTLLRNAVDARYVATGHLVFMRQGTLHAVAFDAERLLIRGPEVPIIDEVAQVLFAAGVSDDISGAGQFAISSTGTLAWLPGPVAALPPYELVSVDRRGHVSPLPAPKRSYAPRVSLSPDGRRLAVTIHGVTGENPWVYDLIRRTLTLLSSDGEAGWQLWSPDGQRLLYRWRKNGRAFLGWQPTDGSGPIQALAPRYVVPCSWSPDGKLAGVTYKNSLDDADIAVVTIENKQARVQVLDETPQFEGWPQFSPDGRWLAFGSEVSGRNEVYVRAYPPPGPSIQVSVNGGQSPVWSRSGHELLYVGDCGSGGCPTLPTPTTLQMMSVDFEGGSPPRASTPRMLFAFEGQELAFGLSPCRPYDVTPDGERFFVRRLLPLPPLPVVTYINLVQNWFEELKAKVPTTR